jgi:hypothetical protein
MDALLRPLDTTDEAYRLQCEIYRRQSGTERLAAVFRLNQLVREMAVAGIRQRHPDYDDAQVRCALRRLVLGDELTAKAWPNLALVDP